MRQKKESNRVDVWLVGWLRSSGALAVANMIKEKLVPAQNLRLRGRGIYVEKWSVIRPREDADPDMLLYRGRRIRAEPVRF